jgi:hypothetical protein
MNSLLKGEEFIDFPLDEIKTNFETYGFERRIGQNGKEVPNAYVRNLNSQVRLFVKPKPGKLSAEVQNSGWKESDDAEVKYIDTDYRGKNLNTKGKFVISVRYENPLNEEIPIGPIDYRPQDLYLVKPSIRALGGEPYLELMRQKEQERASITRARNNAKRKIYEEEVRKMGQPPGFANNPGIKNWKGGRRTRRTRRIKRRRHSSTRGRF